jgi:hypothetical protein
MVRKIVKDGKVYKVTFDNEGIVDTVELDGKLLVSTNKVVKIILNNSEDILHGFAPKGFTWL